MWITLTDVIMNKLPCTVEHESEWTSQGEYCAIRFTYFKNPFIIIHCDNKAHICKSELFVIFTVKLIFISEKMSKF